MNKIFFLLSLILFLGGIYLFINKQTQFDFEIAYIVLASGLIANLFCIYTFFQNSKFNLIQKENEFQLKKEIRFYKTNRKIFIFLFLILIVSIIFLIISKEIFFLKIIFLTISIFSLFMIVLVYFKFIFSDYISFCFDGLIFGNRNCYYILRFDNIQKNFIKTEKYKNILCIKLINPEDCTRYLFCKNGKREKLILKIYKTFSTNLKSYQSEVQFVPEKYFFNSTNLLDSIEKYLHFPETRNELK